MKNPPLPDNGITLVCRSPGWRRLFTALLVFTTLPAPGDEAISESPRFFAITSDNDIYASRNDRHYTNSLRLSFGLPRGKQAAWRDWLGNLLPLKHDPETREYTVSIGQSIYTPEAFASPAPQFNDRPFAGWLYGELAMTAHSPGVQESLAVNAGVVGPAALGRQAQGLIHDLTGDAEPRGWRNQLDNEPALLIRYDRNWFLDSDKYRHVDLVPGIGVSAGNVITEASASALLRFGSFLPQRHTPVSIQPSRTSFAGHFTHREGQTDWMLYIGGGARVVAHNIFLDGNTFEDSLSVKKKPLVGYATAGLTLTFGDLPLQFAFACILESKEFDGQRETNRYGSAAISLQY